MLEIISRDDAKQIYKNESDRYDGKNRPSEMAMSMSYRLMDGLDFKVETPKRYTNDIKKVAGRDWLQKAQNRST